MEQSGSELCWKDTQMECCPCVVGVFFVLVMVIVLVFLCLFENSLEFCPIFRLKGILAERKGCWGD